MKKLLVAGTLALLLGGCASPEVQVQLLRSPMVAKPFVEVLRQIPDRPYISIAKLSLSGTAGTAPAQIIAKIEQKAAALGANAIILHNTSRTEAPNLNFNPSGGNYQIRTAEVIPSYNAEAIYIPPAPR
ncbi:MAG: hypothetical protein PHG39_04880 [Acidithiobacillus ferrooxidans]|nr:hypothetical protein [Acidithiobacillus ferrooxidans]MDD5002621.1 hypothetical protein [Acidithiobacillus sp.]MDD5379142.1 hypothetical protein [Acidithiobacillus sp.]MDD5575517.1 hypothetical protein [Acidithiobacillus sp.]